MYTSNSCAMVWWNCICMLDGHGMDWNDREASNAKCNNT